MERADDPDAVKDYLRRYAYEQLARSAAVDPTVRMWNDFNSKSGSIAAEYSSF